MQNTPISEKLRRAQYLFPNDSLTRAAERMSDAGLTALPVLQDGRLTGLITEENLLNALQMPGAELQAVRDWVSPIEAIVDIDSSVEEAVEVLSRTHAPLLVVTDSMGRYLGVLTTADLMRRNMLPPKPPLVGGMATPLGVYLTTGTISAGPQTFALMLTGALLFLLLTIANGTVVGLAQWIQDRGGLPLMSYMMSPFAGTMTMADLMGLIMRGSVYLLFLGLMRALPIAGTHAAEHKVVHAIERNEPLALEVVRRMPRVHPRCGTNLAAGVMLFLGLSELLRFFLPVQGGREMSLMVALVITALSWRSFGAILQLLATTKPPTDQQIQGAIRSAEELMQKYQRNPYQMATPWQRILNAGIIQIMVGAGITSMLVLQITEWLGIPIYWL